MEKQRELGYYWVKKNDRWLICRWDGDLLWRCFDWEESVGDNEWQEIDENRIERGDVEAMNAKHDIKPPTEEDIAKFYRLKDEPLSNYPSAQFGCPDSCKHTGECWASFTADEPCRRTPPSQDWIRARTPSHLKGGNL